MITTQLPADEHDLTINTEGPEATLRCKTCAMYCDLCQLNTAPGVHVHHAHTVALAVRAHRQHVAATDLAHQENIQ